MEAGLCTGCKAPILWVKTAKAGKSVPLDPEPTRGLLWNRTAGGILEAKEKGWRLVTGYDERGENRTVAVAPLTEAGTWVEVRETHFVSCPERSRFRR